ncbi:hypothetical protein ABZP36_025643 [Zizania latifolia]
MDRQRQSPRGNGTAGTRGGGGGGEGGGGGGGAGSGKGKRAKAAGKKPIKVVYISNPMRVKTSAAGFRALVQELTGRNADPSKYSPVDDFGAGAADDCGATPEYCGVAAVASPDTDTGAALAAGHPDDDVAAAADAAAFDESGGGYFDDEDADIFRSQLLDTSYSVFSPPTLLYDHPHSKV